MLMLTENAREVIRAVVDDLESDTAGLRFAGSQNGQDSLTISTATAPAQGDQVVDDAGRRVFIEGSAALLLDDKVLDARMNDDGGVEFLVAVAQ